MKSLSFLSSLLLVAGATLTGCNPYSPELGNSPFRCAAQEPFCPDDYECVRRSDNVAVCEPKTSDSSECRERDSTEPNNDTSGAYDTGVPVLASSVHILGYEICPANDGDYFKFEIQVDNTDIEIDVTAKGLNQALDIAVVTGDDVVVPDTEVTTVSPGVYRLEGANLDQAIYFVRIRGAGGVGEYDLALRLQ